ncbi:hypothetical protein OROMI_016925 [Orobanche minor]
MHRLKSSHLLSLFIAAKSKQSLHLNRPVRLPVFIHSSRRRVMDPPSAAINGIDDFVHKEKGDQISGENHDTISENDCGSNENNIFYERKVLPPELSRSSVMLTCNSAAEGGVCDVFLVGTAHVSAVIL